MESSLGNITKESTFSVEVNTEENVRSTIKKVDFVSSSDQNNVKLRVSNLVDKPEEVANELNITKDARVYQYLDVKLTADDEYIGETGVSTMRFTFTVERSWINNNSMDESTIRMMRYHNDTWEELNTSYVNETEDVLYYEAYTPGLSVFAVVGESIVEDSDVIVDGSTPFPWWVSFGFIASASMLLGVVLVKKRFIYRT
jgi:PGF-pre-PGF domain-containing protein